MHPGDRAAVALFQAESLDRDVARRALVLECLDKGIGRRGAVEDAVEAMLVAVGRAMDVAPSAPVPDVVLVDYHLEAARPEPLLEELRLRPGPPDEIAWRVELAGDVDERDATRCVDDRSGHVGLLICGRSMVSRGCRRRLSAAPWDRPG